MLLFSIGEPFLLLLPADLAAGAGRIPEQHTRHGGKPRAGQPQPGARVALRSSREPQTRGPPVPGRVADPVHFRPDPDPDPANQNFKTGSRIRILLKKSTFFLSRIFFAWFMTKKKLKNVT